MKLTKGELFIIEWQYRIAGSFYAALANACCCADEENLSRLEEGFPEEVKAYKCYTRLDGWWEKVKDKAKANGWNIV